MILVIGYGNPLRSDDGIGQVIAQSFEGCEGLRVVAAYQLTPELAEPISQAAHVIFVDAREGDIPGTIFQEQVQPEAAHGAFTHNLTPASLLAAAGDLYGKAPRGVLVSIVGASFDYGSELSPLLCSRLTDLRELIDGIVYEVSTEEFRHA